jgi:exosome complex component RRP43
MEEYNSGESEDEQPEVRAYWTLYIDLIFISYDGNPFDAAWAAAVAALRDTKLPRAWWDADQEMVVCSRAEPKPLSVSGLPIACTAAVLMEREHGEGGKHWVLQDPDRLEESLCDETITMVVDCSTGQSRIRSISKYGGSVIGPASMRDFVRRAEKRWAEFRKALEMKEGRAI